MPVSINVPSRRDEKDPLDKLATALQIAKTGFGIYTDLQLVDEAKSRKAEEDKLRKLQTQKLEKEMNSSADDDNPNSPMMASIREVAAKRGINLPEGTTPKQARTNFDAFLKPKDAKQSDPFVEEMRRGKIEDEKLKRTPRGKLASLPSGDKQRFDNVVLSIDAVTGMENALKNGDWTFSAIGDNDFTRNVQKWNEAVGRMQSGGAISDSEAANFRKMVPGATDSADQQAKKLADMRVVMEQRFGTFGFDKSQAEDLGLMPSRLGWDQPQGDAGPGNKADKPAVPADIQAAARVELARRRSQAKK